MNLEDTSPVLRGGIPDVERWLDSVLDAVDEGGEPVLSVFGDNARDLESQYDLVRRIAETADVKHGKIAVTTVKEVLQLGLTLEHDPSEGQSENHFHIVFPAEPSIIEMRELVAVFSDPFPNPCK